MQVSGHFSIYEQLLDRNVQRFRVGLVFKAHRLLYHSTLGLGVIKKKSRASAAFTHRSEGCVPGVGVRVGLVFAGI